VAGAVEERFTGPAAVRAACAAEDGTRPLAFAFSANRSQRSPKARRSAAISGELANLARRAHSAACARQYITYDDITRSQHTPARRLAIGQVHCAGHAAATASIHGMPCAKQGDNRPVLDSMA
jgi:hypothetical protein